jgi:hypothetical protein
MTPGRSLFAYLGTVPGNGIQAQDFRRDCILGGIVNTKILTKKDLRLRLQAARVLERSVPDQIRRAHGDVPAQVGGGSADEALLAETRAKARASLIDKGLLTPEEIDSLPVTEATSVALERLREQIAALQAEQARDRTTAESFVKPPRTLRR